MTTAKRNLNSKWSGLESWGLITGALILVALGLVASGGCGKKSAHRERTAEEYADLKAKVIAEIQNGKLVPDASGTLVLPAEMKAVCSGGVVYVSKHSQAGTLIAFADEPVDGHVTGLLHTEHEISQKLTELKIGPFYWKVGMRKDSKECFVTRK